MYYTRLVTHTPKNYEKEYLIQFVMSGGQAINYYDDAPTLQYMTHKNKADLPAPTPELIAEVERHTRNLQGFMSLKQFKGSKHQHYRKFKIPKRKGGYREITAPNSELKALQTFEKEFIESTLKCYPHNAAHAYRLSRGIKTNAQAHQESRYFLNIDMKNFFPSHNKRFVEAQLLNIYPLNHFPQYVKLIIDLAELDNGLPQGTPLSPLLTNLCCVAFDYELTRNLYQYYEQRTDTKAIIKYTRYADDCTFSSVHHFNHHDILNVVSQTLRQVGAPFKIHPEKTKFTTHKGKNRITGLKVNANNDVTVGYKEKELLKHQLYQLLSKENYPKESDLTRLIGWLAFLYDIEPGYYEFLCKKYNQGESLISTLNKILSTRY